MMYFMFADVQFAGRELSPFVTGSHSGGCDHMEVESVFCLLSCLVSVGRPSCSCRDVQLVCFCELF